MRIAVVGAGAVGGVFGGLLAHGGHEVAFVATTGSRPTSSRAPKSPWTKTRLGLGGRGARFSRLPA